MGVENCQHMSVDSKCKTMCRIPPRSAFLLRLILNGWRLGLADRNATDERFPAFFTPLTQSVSFLEKQA